MWKNTFQKKKEKMFNEFWFIVRQQEYIYISEIKLGNFYSRVILGAKQMLVYAN